VVVSAISIALFECFPDSGMLDAPSKPAAAAQGGTSTSKHAAAARSKSVVTVLNVHQFFFTRLFHGGHAQQSLERAARSLSPLLPRPQVLPRVEGGCAQKHSSSSSSMTIMVGARATLRPCFWSSLPPL
jgi:hypothetical protein